MVGLTVALVLVGGGSAAASQVTVKIIELLWSQKCYNVRVQDQKLQSRETSLLIMVRAIAGEAFAWLRGL